MGFSNEAEEDEGEGEEENEAIGRKFQSQFEKAN